jgi:hypothetical protein
VLNLVPFTKTVKRTGPNVITTQIEWIIFWKSVLKTSLLVDLEVLAALLLLLSGESSKFYLYLVGFSLPELWKEVETDLEYSRFATPPLDEYTRQWCFERFLASPTLVEFYLSPSDQPDYHTDEKELYDSCEITSYSICVSFFFV